MFRIQNGHVDFKSRYPRTQRFKAQAAARKRLFGMYRNPFTDDPSVKGVSRGTANTHVVYHHGLLFSLKEDSPPVAMNPITLETVDDYYTFGGGFHSLTHTAHPKFDTATGEMISYGYEAKGMATDDVYVFSANAKGKITWETWVKVPYVGMVHDFAVSQKVHRFPRHSDGHERRAHEAGSGALRVGFHFADMVRRPRARRRREGLSAGSRDPSAAPRT